MKTTTRLFFALLAFASLFAAEPCAQAVSPAPDGCYPNYTTAEGCNALNSLTTGIANTGLGWYALSSDTTANYNTAVGAGALVLNNADANTATGVAALLLNTTGTENTANGVAALLYNDSGSENTANGAFALYRNTTGHDNAATGQAALVNNTTGADNTANGVTALRNNTSGNNNIAVGSTAGFNLTTGDNNIDIGNEGVAAEANTIRIGSVQTATYIAGISGAVVPGGVTVIVDVGGHLGTIVSSQRFKDGIKAMDKASEAILALKPVTFLYKKEIDPMSIPQFGLVAEEVEKVNPDLVVRDKEGKPYSVRYDQVNAMLLNEFLKEHRKNEEQEATIARLTSTDAKQEATIAKQQKQIEALTAGLQKVSAQIEMSKPAPQMVTNNH
jgi:hypothetical protein